MEVGLLRKLFGVDQQWHGACTVILDAEASMQMVGSDSVVSGGAKVYSPRVISGRVSADAACLLADGSAIVLLVQQKTRQPTGEEVIKQTLTVADPTRVVAVEFADVVALANLGLQAPLTKSVSMSGIMKR